MQLRCESERFASKPIGSQAWARCGSGSFSEPISAVRHMKFLGGNVPEAALLHELDKAYDPQTPTKEAKAHFAALTAKELGKESVYESPTSADILATQQRKLTELVKLRKESLLLASAFKAVEAVLPPGHG